MTGPHADRNYLKMGEVKPTSSGIDLFSGGVSGDDGDGDGDGDGDDDDGGDNDDDDGCNDDCDDNGDDPVSQKCAFCPAKIDAPNVLLLRIVQFKVPKIDTECLKCCHSCCLFFVILVL